MQAERIHHYTTYILKELIRLKGKDPKNKKMETQKELNIRMGMSVHINKNVLSKREQ